MMTADDRIAVLAWLPAKGFIRDEHGHWVIAWSCRSGYDFTDLEFYAHDYGFDAIVGHHASGTNPRLHIGTCETFADVRMVYDTLRRINGFHRPEPELDVASLPDAVDPVAPRRD